MRESEITALPPHLTPEEILRDHIDRVEEIRFEWDLGGKRVVNVIKFKPDAG